MGNMIQLQNMGFLFEKQYSIQENLKARWNVYNFCHPKTDIYQRGLEALEIKGSENILEVGCEKGNLLMEMRKKGHTGRLVGLDIHESIFEEAEKDSVEFVVASADNLNFPSESFDCVFSFFMLYHMFDIQKTLEEWERVLKIGGKVLIATESLQNRPKHKILKHKISKLMDINCPPRFSHTFNLENGKEQLTKVFDKIEVFIFDSVIHLKNSKPYIDAFDSIRNVFIPFPSNIQWKESMEFVRQEIEKEIKNKGYFTDYCRRGFFVCTKDF